MRSWSPLSRRLDVLREVRRRGALLEFLRDFGVAVAAPGLMRIPLARLDSLIELWARGEPQPSQSPESVAATVLDVLGAGWPLVRRGCLTRGLTLYCALRRAGIQASLEFGMGRVATGDGFDGHCWVVLDGRPFLEARDPYEHYAKMYALGARADKRTG